MSSPLEKQQQLEKENAKLKEQVHRSNVELSEAKWQHEQTKLRYNPPVYCKGCGNDLSKVIYCYCERND